MYNCNPRCSSVASYYNEIFVFLKVDRKKPLCDLLKRLKMTSCIGMFFLPHFFLLFNFSFQLEGTHIEPVLHDTRQDNKQLHQQQQQQSKEQQ